MDPSIGQQLAEILTRVEAIEGRIVMLEAFADSVADTLKAQAEV